MPSFPRGRAVLLDGQECATKVEGEFLSRVSKPWLRRGSNGEKESSRLLEPNGISLGRDEAVE